jgi:hypothetical protein
MSFEFPNRLLERFLLVFGKCSSVFQTSRGDIFLASLYKLVLLVSKTNFPSYERSSWIQGPMPPIYTIVPMSRLIRNPRADV